MKKTETNHHAFFLFLLTNALFLLLISSAIAGPNGFTLKLIHMDSIESPFHPGNLTHEESFQRLAERSKARLRYLTLSNNVAANYSSNNQTTSEIDPNSASLATLFEGLFYMALVGIGTFPGQNPDYKNYYVLVDSGSELLWTQCSGSQHWFDQNEPFFPQSTSTSYRTLPCEAYPPCPPGYCRNDECHYERSYATGSTTYGVLAYERFTLTSGNGAPETFNDIIFGCGLDQVNFKDFLNRPEAPPNEITGIMGIGGGPMSFLTQLGPRGGGRFSHCLQPYTAGFNVNTFLRFGEDADIRVGGIQSTPMPAFAGRIPAFYHIELHGISVANQLLPIPPEWLKLYRDERTGHRRGGCIVDSGCPWTHLHERVYLILQNAVVSYFAQFNMLPLGEDKDKYFKLCYNKPAPNFWKYPIIKFHLLDGAEFTMDPINGFYIKEDIFCLAFSSDSSDEASHVLFGAWQMTNHRVLYDVWNERLSFAPENCVMGA